MKKDKVIRLKTGYQGPKARKGGPRFFLSSGRKKELRLYPSLLLNKDLHRVRKADAELPAIRQIGHLKLIKDD